MGIYSNGHCTPLYTCAPGVMSTVRTVGVIIGKFYPYHRGHNKLIQIVREQCDVLAVIVCEKDGDAVTGVQRANWIKWAVDNDYCSTVESDVSNSPPSLAKEKCHTSIVPSASPPSLLTPSSALAQVADSNLKTAHRRAQVKVIVTKDDIPETSKAWALRTLKLLRAHDLKCPPDKVFTSESYGEEYATLMGSRHIFVNARLADGRKIRADLATHWQDLVPPAKTHFAKRVVVLGVESSGTTTLARALAKHYQTAWVPEYGRYYWEGRQHTPKATQWGEWEFVNIARAQQRWEDEMATTANRVLICDTDALTTCVWHWRYRQTHSAAVERVADSRDYALYILTAPSFGFVQDGTRELEHDQPLRMSMHAHFRQQLRRKKKRWVEVTGDLTTRMQTITPLIDSLLKFDVLSYTWSAEAKMRNHIEIQKKLKSVENAIATDSITD